MEPKKVYGYIRVSTVKQGSGVSLQEQKEAIVRYAERHNLNIIDWFEEQETAAKQGRPLFNQMMKLISSGKTTGVIIHKIDRSARNLKDWASLGDLIDQGFEIHFAHESLDMNARGGRLSADIQAVIASDYIRNLREEAIKGLYGRLKQGLYPFYAPIGYVNTGKGQIKQINKTMGPLIRKAFELYGTGNYTLKTLVREMNQLGLRNSSNNKIGVTAMALILHNPFYTGIMKIKGKTYQGKHEPLVSPKLYLRVQDILNGKTNTRIIKHNFVFRRMIRCSNCNYSLIGEIRKGHTYYRCQTKSCPTKSIREELIYELMNSTLDQIKLTTEEDNVLTNLLVEAQNNWLDTQKGLEDSLQMQRNQLSIKFDRLTDAFLENIVDKTQYELKKEQLLIRQQELKHSELNLDFKKEAIIKKASKFLGLLKDLKNSFILGTHEEKRRIIKLITSDFKIHSKKLMISMQSPFKEIAERANSTSSELARSNPRTKIAELAICFCEDDSLLNDHHSNCTQENANINKDNLPEVNSNSRLKIKMNGLLDLILQYCEMVENNQKINFEKDYDEKLNSSAKHSF